MWKNENTETIFFPVDGICDMLYLTYISIRIDLISADSQK